MREVPQRGMKEGREARSFCWAVQREGLPEGDLCESGERVKVCRACVARDAVGSPGRDLRFWRLPVGPGEKWEWQEAVRS